MDLRLTGKIALVTGSTAGIGFAIAKALACEGAHVYVNGRKQERVDAATVAIPSHAAAAWAGNLRRSKRATSGILPELPEAVRGRFRGVQVWIGSADSTRETARYVPPPPESVPRLVDQWLEWWHERHRALQGQPKDDVVVGLAELHRRFLKIHPFMDANGRVARSITDQAARELLNEGIGAEFIADTQAY